MIQLGGLDSLLHLLLMVMLTLVYVRWRSIVILPAVMLSSLAGVFLGLGVHPFISGMIEFAVPLLVFVAGLKLKPEFISREKERVILMGFVEAALFLTFFYLASSLLPLETALTLSSLVVASNEMFAIQASRFRGGDIGLYGITLSVFEDIMAVFLLSLGFFTFTAQPTGEELGFKLAATLSLIPLLYFLSGPFDKLIDRIENAESKILLTILYLAVLVAFSEVPHIPEALVVFIGAVMLSLRRFDEETFNAVESYLSLALIGFVATLPYLPSSSLPESGLNPIPMVLAGFALALAAFVVRGVFVFLASLLAGLPLDDCLTLSLALANTGEFGLVVLSYLIGSSELIPPEYAYTAMFAYAFNLTMVSFIASRSVEISGWIKARLGKVTPLLTLLSESGNRFVNLLAADVKLKKAMVELALIVIIGYSSISLYGLVKVQPISYVLSLVIVSSFMSALQKLFQEFSSELGKSEKIIGVFTGLIKALLLYVIAAPLINFISQGGGSGGLLYLTSPVNLIIVLAITYGISKLTSKAVDKLLTRREM